MRDVQRSQAFIYHSNDSNYAEGMKMCYKARNIKNEALYIGDYIVWHYFDRHQYVPSGFIKPRILTVIKYQYRHHTNSLYAGMDTRICEQIIKDVGDSFEDYFKSLHAYKKNSKKFINKPRMPKPHKSGKPATFNINNQTIKLDKKKQQLLLSSSSKRAKRWKQKMGHNIQLDKHQRINKLLQTQFVPHNYYLKIVATYQKSVPDLKPDNHHYLSVDVGKDNYLAVSANFVEWQNLIYRGIPIKQIDEDYLSKIRYLQSLAKKINGRYSTHQIDHYFAKMHLRNYNFNHEVCKSLLKYALDHDVCEIVIGNGASKSQRSCELSKKLRRIYCRTPFGALLRTLTYMGDDVGIKVTQAEESYTSQTDFLMNEVPKWFNGNKARELKHYSNPIRRIKRGLFESDAINPITHKHYLVNADINGNLQIMKKVHLHAFDNLTFQQKVHIATNTPLVVSVPKV